MDPQAAYDEMVSLFRSGNLDEARDRALAIQRWVHIGGFEIASWGYEEYSLLFRLLYYVDNPFFRPQPLL
jgi:hypothetical protein